MAVILLILQALLLTFVVAVIGRFVGAIFRIFDR